MSTQVKPPPRLPHSGRRECGTRHSSPVLDRRVAARICRHHSNIGLHITIRAGVAGLSFRLPFDTAAEVRAMREVRNHTGAYRIIDLQHRVALAQVAR